MCQYAVAMAAERDAEGKQNEMAESTDPPAPLDLEAVMAALTAKYDDNPHLRRHREMELPQLRSTLGNLMVEIADQYEVVGVFNPGGGGVPILLQDVRLGRQRCVLKLPRPVVGSEAALNRILSEESKRLVEVRHPHIVRILVTGTTGPTDIPYYVMELVPGAEDADVYLKEHPTLDALLAIVEGAVVALAHIHALGIVHTDVKPGNLFVDAGGRTILADFGFAKRIEGGESKTVLVGGTSGYMHPEQVLLLQEINQGRPEPSDPRRQISPLDRPIDRSRIKAYWDLYSLGITILSLLKVLEGELSGVRNDYRFRYLSLMAYRLVGQSLSFARENTRVYPGLDISDTIFGLTGEDTRELQYRDIHEVLDDLRKLLGTKDLVKEIPELNRHQIDMIQAASHGPVPFTERVRRIVHTPEVRRLGSLTQLGLVSQVYPTATHTRLEHTLGTFSLVCRYIRALYNDPINPIFRQIMRAEDIEAILLVALVHDIGHYPLAHDLEEVDPHIFGHELRTHRLLTDKKVSLLAQVLAGGNTGWSVDTERLTALLRASDDPEKAPFRDSVLSAIIDGPIDADKIDYLIRDSENLRVPYGRGIDFDRLISSATVVVVPVRTGGFETQRFPSLGIHDRGRMAAESLAFARYAMYGSVYWHRTHRTLKAMLNRLAYEALDLQSHTPDGELKPRWQREVSGHLNRFLDIPLQQRLRVTHAIVDDARFDDGSTDGGFLDSATEQMLDWLSALAPHDASELADDLRRRRLYDRVLVTSEYRTSDLPWPTIQSVFGQRGNSNKAWERRLRFAWILEEEVSKVVAKWDRRTAPGQTVFAPELADVFIARVGRAPLLLVDYPIAKTGSRHALHFLFEREWRDPESDAFEAIAADQSPLWKAVSEQLQSSLAKLRVYCHPDFSPLVSGLIPRREMEKLIAVSLDRLGRES